MLMEKHFSPKEPTSEPLLPASAKEAWRGMISEAAMDRLLASEGVKPGRKSRKVSDGEVAGAIVMRHLSRKGGLAAGGAMLEAAQMSEAAYSQRRAGLPVGLFERLCTMALGPIASPEYEPDAFVHGQRVVALDGTTFQMANTEAILGKVAKRKSGDAENGFPLLQMVVSIEVATYAPLSARVSTERSEVAMLEELAAELPERCLVIADRGFGTAPSAFKLERCLRPKGSDFLLRIRENLNVEQGERLADGSHIVHMPLYDPEHRGMVLEEVKLREIHLILITRDKREVKLRFWTSLTNAETHPSEMLGELYAARWEIEGYFRSLKNFVHDGTLLHSQTAETALQDAFCIVIASHLEARARQVAARATNLKVKLLSLAKTIDLITGFWQFCTLAQDMLNAEQLTTLYQRLFTQIATYAKTQPRRARTCQRAKRQIQSTFPKVKKRTYSKGPTKLSKPQELA
jgi:hypothetical protein